MKCRVCGSDRVRVVGIHKPYLEYECEVYECEECRCRFVTRDETIYEKLHAASASPYSAHERAALSAYKYFASRDIANLRAELSKVRKFSFVIEMVEKEPNVARLLEYGCSKGTLTSYFIARGFDVVAADISLSAVQFARELFGNYFVTPTAPEIELKRPYDLIYHVGTIGCVESPIDLTKYLLSLLRNGGLLIFNAPNVEACREVNEIWIRSANPPDLVTLFSASVWKTQFGQTADVSVLAERLDGYEQIQRLIGRLRGAGRQRTTGVSVFATGERVLGRRCMQNRFLRCAAGVFRAGVRLAGKAVVFPKRSAEFGMYVIMRKCG